MGYSLFIITFLVALVSCNPQSNHDLKYKDNLSSPNKIFKNDSSEIHRDTLILNNQQVIQTLKHDQFYSLTFLSGDSIITCADYYFKAEFPDIDGDGFKDIRVFVFSNTPNQCENYLFDKISKTFRLIENCYLDIQLIRGTKLFYTYSSTGCSDMSWESHLSKIENWQEINIGFMNTKDCGDEDDGIYIYKINGNDEKLISTIKIKKFDNNGKNNKWNFIKSYWTKYHSKFER